MINPKLDHDDFDAAVVTAQAEFDEHQPDVIVGSSRGGAVTLNIRSGNVPLVLLCPAWKKAERGPCDESERQGDAKVKSILDDPAISGRYLFPQDRNVDDPFLVKAEGAELACYRRIVDAEALTVIHFHGNEPAHYPSHRKRRHDRHLSRRTQSQVGRVTPEAACSIPPWQPQYDLAGERKRILGCR